MAKKKRKYTRRAPIVSPLALATARTELTRAEDQLIQANQLATSQRLQIMHLTKAAFFGNQALLDQREADFMEHLEAESRILTSTSQK